MKEPINKRGARVACPPRTQSGGTEAKDCHGQAPDLTIFLGNAGNEGVTFGEIFWWEATHITAGVAQ